MAEDRWTDFIEWARRARAKPAFDLEEREYRLGVAEALRGLIEAARDGRPLGGELAAVGDRMAKIDPMVVPGRQLQRLADWARRDEEGVARALRDFSEPVDDPEARVGRFVEAVAAGPSSGRFGPDGLVVASLMNFAMSPERLPVVRLGEYRRLQMLLGEEPSSQLTAMEEYGRCVAFARKVESELIDAGVPVRDMVDVESLIKICSHQHEFWAGSGDAADSRRRSEPDICLAVCAMYRNEAAYLAEWIEFHLLMGVERFFLYDNESEDDSLDVLAPYLDEGIVVRYEQSGSARSNTSLDAIKIPAFEQCIATHGAETRWIAFIDTDEFLFSPTGRPLPEILVEHERWPAVAVNGALFGTSGHVTRPAGLVLENYTKRLDQVVTRHQVGGRLIKSVVDPATVTRCVNAHRFEYTRGTAVDEHGYPAPPAIKTKSPSFQRLRINHYFARSEEDLRAKYERRVADHRERRPQAFPDWDAIREEHSAGEQDELILRYVPALREALRRRAAHRTPSGH